MRTVTPRCQVKVRREEDFWLVYTVVDHAVGSKPIHASLHLASAINFARYWNGFMGEVARLGLPGGLDEGQWPEPRCT